MEFNEWKEVIIEEDVLQKQIFSKIALRVSDWLYGQDLWKIPVKKFNFSNAADL